MNDELTQLAKQLGEEASRLGLRIAVAESLTGGLLASSIVSSAGASHYFAGAIVAYDTAIKHSVLNVDLQRLREVGPVDAEVARQMARNVREVCTASLEEHDSVRLVEIGVATTGVAGPDPDGFSGLAPGTVWVGVSSALGERALLLDLSGDRDNIRHATVRAALSEAIAEIETLTRMPQAPEN